MSIGDFINQHNGKFLDFDGFYGAQCVDLVQFWAKANGWPTFTGNAVDIANQTHGFYTWVPNSPSGVPAAGNIVVWGPYAPHGITSAGHIAAATGTGNTSSFDSFDQNWPTGSSCHVQHHDYGGVLGWLVAPGATNNQGGQMIIGSGDNWYARCNLTHQMTRGRDLPRADFNAFVGQEFLHFVETCEDDPEAKATQNAQNVGVVALRDNWQGQIGTLQSQLNDARVQITSQSQTIDQLNAQVKLDQQQVVPVAPLPQPQPPAPVPEPPSPASSNNSIVITKDGLWAKVKTFLTKLGL